jgi:chromosome segregation ATPase
VIAALKAKVAALEAELAKAEERSAGHRADFEHERERADRLVTTQDKLVAELEALRSLLETAEQAARLVTSRRWREMSWGERWRWLRTTG